jgi:hypothetical protein
MTIDLGEGKQIVLSADLGRLWTQIFANRGSLGVELTPEQAMEYGLALWLMGRRERRSNPPQST